MRQNKSDKCILPVPQQTGGDVALIVAKVFAKFIPFAGGPASEVFLSLIRPPVEKRGEEWMQSVIDGFRSLSERVDDLEPEKLAENPCFISTLLQASNVAMKSHQKIKLDALRNAVLNSALPNAPEDDLQVLFLSLIDSFATWHLRILKYFENPVAALAERSIKAQAHAGVTPSQMLERAYPELENRREFYYLIASELNTKGLIEDSPNS